MDLNNIPEAFTLPLRLSLISCLITGEKTFNELKFITGGSDGNIVTQLKKLELWGYIKSEKRFCISKNITYYRFTSFGLNEFQEYIILLEKILDNLVAN